jgi:hypothetical protein
MSFLVFTNRTAILPDRLLPDATVIIVPNICFHEM